MSKRSQAGFPASSSSKKQRGGGNVKNEVTSASDDWRLQVEKQPPSFPFHETFFPIEVLLVDATGKLVKSRDSSMCFPLKITLVSSTDRVSEITSSRGKNDPVIQISENTPAIIGQNGRVELNVKIMELSSFHNGRKFCLKVEPADPGLSEKMVMPVFSVDMKVVSQRLILNGSTPETWYKDQGGRENCILLNVHIEGPDHIPLLEDIPLSVKLLYDDRTMVRDHDKILMIHPDSVLLIPRNTRKTQLKLRIEDVSKNHQSKGFVFCVEPEKVAHKTDISTVHSEKIMVKSKVSKKKNVQGNGLKADSRKQQKRAPVDINTGLLQTADTSRIRGFLPNASQSGAVRNPPNILSDASRYDKLQKDGNKLPAVHTAAWCDAVKNSLFELQTISIQRLVVENRLWKLLGDYGNILPFLKDQVEKAQEASNDTTQGTASSSGPSSIVRPASGSSSDFTRLPQPSSSISFMMQSIGLPGLGSDMARDTSMGGLSDIMRGESSSTREPSAEMYRGASAQTHLLNRNFLETAASVSSGNYMAREHSLQPRDHSLQPPPQMPQDKQQKGRLMQDLLNEYETTKNT